MIHPQALIKLFGYHFHEAQHAGQLLYIAQYLGKQDVWLA